MSPGPLERTLIIEVPTDAAKGAVSRHGILTVLTGSSLGAVFVLEQPQATIGRGDGVDFRIEDPGVSRTHARIHRAGEHYEIEDLGSSNGVFLDGSRVQQRGRLREGARVRIGTTLLRFSLQDEVEQAASRRIYDLSVCDSLTGLFNRRYLDERIAAEVAFAIRHGTALALLLVDIDHFKQVNDQRGHQAGDAVLQRVSQEIRAGVRTEDVVARLGGEEFAVLARGIDVAGARTFAERIRLMIADASVSYDARPIAVTVSVGVAHNHAGTSLSKPAALIAAADQALYAAKHGGRNRVCVATSPGRYSSSGAEHAPPRQRRARSWEVATSPADVKSREPSRRASTEPRSR